MRPPQRARPPEGAAPRGGVVLAAALAVVAAAYLNALQGPFVWDDRELVLKAPLARQLDPGAHLTSAFWHRTAAAEADTTYFRPLSTYTYAVDWRLWDGRPAGFHLTNLLLHLCVVALVFLLARRAGASPPAAGLAAALFGVFPRLTESVTWISGRTDLLAAALALGALLLHGDGSARLGRRLGAAGLIFLGLFAKEVAAAAVVGVAALELAAALRREKAWRAAAAAAVPAALAAVAYAAVRLLALQGVRGAGVAAADHRALMPIQALGQYVLMAIDPRPRLQIGLLGRLEPAPLAVGLLAAGALALAAARALRRPPAPRLAGLAATGLAALAAVLHLVPIPVNVVAADRFLYVPAACLAALLAALAPALARPRRRLAGAAAAAALAAYLPITVLRNEDWADEVRLWREAVATSPRENDLAANELGSALRRAGRLEEALAAYQAAAEGARSLARHRGGDSALVLSNVAATLSDLGRLEEARARQAELVRLEPGRPVNLYNLALIDLRLLRLDDAEAALAEALRLMPGYPDAERARARMAGVRATVAALPPERPDEPTPVLARRARLWTQLDLAPRAAPLWDRLARRADASLAEVEEAAAYLIVSGDLAAAEAAVARATALGAAPERREALQAGLRERAAR